MDKTTIRPTGTLANGGSVCSTGTDRDALLRDESDTTYVDLPATATFYNALGLTFDDPGIDPDDYIFAAVLYYRAKAESTYGFAAVQAGQWLVTETGDTDQAIPAATGSTVFALADYPVLGAGGVDVTDLSVAIWNSPAGKWGGGGDVTLRLYDVWIDIYSIPQPAVDVTAPTGTSTDNSELTVTWTPTLDPTQFQAGYDVRVYTSAQYGAGGFDPNVTVPYAAIPNRGSEGAGINKQYGYQPGNNTSWRMPPLPNGTYRAYVRVWDAPGGQSRASDWDYTQFTIGVTAPDLPAMVVADDPAHGRVAITVTPDNSPVDTDGWTLERSLDLGLTYTIIETHVGGSAATFYDYWAPNGQPVTYRVKAYNDVVNGRLFSGALVDQVTPNQGMWIKSKHDPSLNFKVEKLRQLPGPTREARTTILQPAGRTDSVAISDTFGPWSGEITMLLRTAAEQHALAELIESSPAVYLQAHVSDDFDDRWVTFSGESYQRLIEQKYGSPFDVTMTWTEVSEP